MPKFDPYTGTRISSVSEDDVPLLDFAGAPSRVRVQSLPDEAWVDSNPVSKGRQFHWVTEGDSIPCDLNGLELNRSQAQQHATSDRSMEQTRAQQATFWHAKANANGHGAPDSPVASPAYVSSAQGANSAPEHTSSPVNRMEQQLNTPRVLSAAPVYDGMSTFNVVRTAQADAFAATPSHDYEGQARAVINKPHLMKESKFTGTPGANESGFPSVNQFVERMADVDATCREWHDKTTSRSRVDVLAFVKTALLPGESVLAALRLSSIANPPWQHGASEEIYTGDGWLILTSKTPHASATNHGSSGLERRLIFLQTAANHVAEWPCHVYTGSESHSQAPTDGSADRTAAGRSFTSKYSASHTSFAAMTVVSVEEGLSGLSSSFLDLNTVACKTTSGGARSKAFRRRFQQLSNSRHQAGISLRHPNNTQQDMLATVAPPPPDTPKTPLDQLLTEIMEWCCCCCNKGRQPPPPAPRPGESAGWTFDSRTPTKWKEVLAEVAAPLYTHSIGADNDTLTSPRSCIRQARYAAKLHTVSMFLKVNSGTTIQPVIAVVDPNEDADAVFRFVSLATPTGSAAMPVGLQVGGMYSALVKHLIRNIADDKSSGKLITTQPLLPFTMASKHAYP